MIAKLFKLIRELGKIFYILNRRQKVIGLGMLLLGIVAAALELLGVTAMIPLITAVLDTEQLMSYDIVQKIVVQFHIEDMKMFGFLICIGVAVVYIVKNIYLLFYVFICEKYSCMVMRELGKRMMRYYMTREYPYFYKMDTSKVMRSMNTDVVYVYELFNVLLTFLRTSVTSIALMAVMLFADLKMSLVLFALALLCLGTIALHSQKIVSENGKQYRHWSVVAQKIILEAFQGIKDVFVLNKRAFFVKDYESAYYKMNKTQIKKAVAESAPNYIMEAICMFGLATLIGVELMNGVNGVEVVTSLSVVGLSAYRVMSYMGNTSGYINYMLFRFPSLDAVYDCFHEFDENEQPLLNSEEKEKYKFDKELRINNIVWRYPGVEQDTLKGLNLSIKRGDSIAIIGRSGAGKTTFADILLGLLKPQSGTIEIDGVNIYQSIEKWYNTIGCVSQTFYIRDDTIRRNIAFGVPDEEIDDAKIALAIEKAQMKEFVDSLPEGLDTEVGERGVRFSGGQKQRIAIARALYHEPSILILDEATSALDNETETAVMSAIDALMGQMTIIIIAHRLSTIERCDRIYEIVDGRAEEKSKDEVLGREDEV